MKNKAIFLLSVLSMSILLSGCVTEKKDSDKIMQYFEKDLYTQKVGAQKHIGDSEITIEKDDKEHSNGYENTLSEITLIGEDTSIAYEVIGGTDVEYKNVIFKNLYTNVHSLTTEYNKNTLINFIVKTYEAKSSTIYTVLYIDEIEAEDSDIEAVTFDEMLSDCDKYENVKHKYGEPVAWMLQFIDSETRHEVQMYGANSYILVTADGVSKEIDMTKYDYDINNETSESNVENSNKEDVDTLENIEETISETEDALDETEEAIITDEETE